MKNNNEARKELAVTITSISILGILALMLIMIFTSCSTTESATIYGNQNSHCAP
jgi:hypothetical protein